MRTNPSKVKLNKHLMLIVPGILLLAAVAVTIYYGRKPVTRPNFPISSAAVESRALTAYGNLPLAFEPNQGQTDPLVKYLARGRGYTLFLTSREAVLSLPATHSFRKAGLREPAPQH